MKLFRGNRVTKCSCDEFDAFFSPNYPPLAELGIDIVLYLNRIFWPCNINQGFRAHTKLCRNVVVLRLFPSITTNAVRAFLQPPVQGKKMHPLLSLFG
ncbi:unnamed protein product [Protopolystoma xenopodis]|uniref:L-asparaginase N-terminal domain-containing protein n=1 Tax=Protopolystoma xenopodis TaxID=117903 RepID=A0A448WX18_9PLAT|nr:unnamed protein product [Protopolystoma xenopodis]